MQSYLEKLKEQQQALKSQMEEPAQKEQEEPRNPAAANRPPANAEEPKTKSTFNLAPATRHMLEDIRYRTGRSFSQTVDEAVAAFHRSLNLQ